MEQDNSVCVNKTEEPRPNAECEEVELKAAGHVHPGKGDRAAELIGDLQIALTEEDVCGRH